jgi:pentatricopeptide repeat protein
MHSRQILLVFLIIISATKVASSQRFIQPGYALKSHETLVIKNIEINPELTVVSMSIENRISGGRFCADRNIFIINPDGSRIKLKSANGIPVCPDEYRFKRHGEKLDFTLIFPQLDPGTEWIDIIEECSDNCFLFYGVVLDNDLNEKINDVVSLAEEGQTGKSIAGYKEIISGLSGKNNGIEGALYSDLISLLMKSGNTQEARRWYDKMIASESPRLEQYIKNLNSRGFIFE